MVSQINKMIFSCFLEFLKLRYQILSAIPIVHKIVVKRLFLRVEATKQHLLKMIKYIFYIHITGTNNFKALLKL